MALTDPTFVFKMLAHGSALLDFVLDTVNDHIEAECGAAFLLSQNSDGEAGELQGYFLCKLQSKPDLFVFTAELQLFPAIGLVLL